MSAMYSGFLSLEVGQKDVGEWLDRYLIGRKNWRWFWKWLDKDRGGDVLKGKLEIWITVSSLGCTISEKPLFCAECDLQCPFEEGPMQALADNVAMKDHHVEGGANLVRGSADQWN